MHIKQRTDKQHLQCESCKEWKDDRFCDWKTYSEQELVVCSKCGIREAVRSEMKLIKVSNTKAVVYTKTKGLGRNESNKSSKRHKTDSLF